MRTASSLHGHARATPMHVSAWSSTSRSCLQPTTIYGLTFVEAGNAWTAVKDFQPFNLKRSAGAGVRIFLPMVGMMGIDWAYGFDTVYGRKGGGQFHFILGQEFKNS